MLSTISLQDIEQMLGLQPSPDGVPIHLLFLFSVQQLILRWSRLASEDNLATRHIILSSAYRNLKVSMASRIQGLTASPILRAKAPVSVQAMSASKMQHWTVPENSNQRSIS